MKVQNPKVVSRNVSPHRSSAVQVALSEEMVGLRRREHCTLTDLCVEDKQKVAKLIRQVVELGQENQQLAADHGKETSKNSDKIQQLRQRNHDIIRENTNLRSKLTHAFALLRTYQHKVRVMDAAMHASQSSGNSQATAGRLPASLALAAAQPQEAAQPAALAPQPVSAQDQQEGHVVQLANAMAALGRADGGAADAHPPMEVRVNSPTKQSAFQVQVRSLGSALGSGAATIAAGSPDQVAILATGKADDRAHLQPALNASGPFSDMAASLLAWHLEESAGNGDGDAELDKGRSRVLRFDPSIGKSGAFYFVELDGQMPALSIAGTSDAGLASTEPSASQLDEGRRCSDSGNARFTTADSTVHGSMSSSQQDRPQHTYQAGHATGSQIPRVEAHYHQHNAGRQHGAAALQNIDTAPWMLSASAQQSADRADTTQRRQHSHAPDAGRPPAAYQSSHHQLAGQPSAPPADSAQSSPAASWQQRAGHDAGLSPQASWPNPAAGEALGGAADSPADTPARAWGGPGGTPPAYHAHDTPANVREVAVPQVDPANIAFRVSVPRPGRERNDLSMAGGAPAALAGEHSAASIQSSASTDSHRHGGSDTPQQPGSMAAQPDASAGPTHLQRLMAGMPARNGGYPGTTVAGPMVTTGNDRWWEQPQPQPSAARHTASSHQGWQQGASSVPADAATLLPEDAPATCGPAAAPHAEAAPSQRAADRTPAGSDRPKAAKPQGGGYMHRPDGPEPHTADAWMPSKPAAPSSAVVAEMLGRHLGADYFDDALMDLVAEVDSMVSGDEASSVMSEVSSARVAPAATGPYSTARSLHPPAGPHRLQPQQRQQHRPGRGQSSLPVKEHVSTARRQATQPVASQKQSWRQPHGSQLPATSAAQQKQQLGAQAAHAAMPASAFQGPSSWHNGDMYEENDVISLISEQEYESYQA